MDNLWGVSACLAYEFYFVPRTAATLAPATRSFGRCCSLFIRSWPSCWSLLFFNGYANEKFNFQ